MSRLVAGLVAALVIVGAGVGSAVAFVSTKSAKTHWVIHDLGAFHLLGTGPVATTTARSSATALRRTASSTPFCGAVER